MIEVSLKDPSSNDLDDVAMRREPPPSSRPRTFTPEMECMRDEVRRRLAANIRLFAHRRGMCMSGLAEEAHVSRAQLYAVLGRRSAPSLDWMCKLAAALEVDPGELLKVQDPLNESL